MKWTLYPFDEQQVFRPNCEDVLAAMLITFPVSIYTRLMQLRLVNTPGTSLPFLHKGDNFNDLFSCTSSSRKKGANAF